jgi:hypothetical protein
MPVLPLCLQRPPDFSPRFDCQNYSTIFAGQNGQLFLRLGAAEDADKGHYRLFG